MAAEKAEAILDRYTLTRRLAIGGMAEVWLARSDDSELSHRRLVLKILLSELAEDPDCVRMFLDEARLAAQLEHPGIVKILDVGQSRGRHYITMEYVAGKTIRQMIQRLRRDKNTLPPWFVLSVASKVCEALEFAHTKADPSGSPLQIVHRDISPENIMVGYSGTVKVLDFGIAKASSLVTRTRVGVMKGKHAYMAPEQILAAESGCAVDRRADIYSLGVVMYEMLTAERPFTADNDLGLIRSVLERGTNTINPCNAATWIDKATGAIVERAMAREPDQRFQTAAELRTAILDYLRARRHDPSERHTGAMLSLIFRADADDQGRLRDSGIPISGLWPATHSEQGASISAVFPAITAAKPPNLPATVLDRTTDDSVAHEFGAEAVTRAGLEAQVVLSAADGPTVTAKQHDWDAALARVRRDKGESIGTSDGAESDAHGESPAPAGERSRLEPPPPSPEEQARIAFERGLDLLRAKDRQAALVALERAVELDPDNRLYVSNLRLLRKQLDSPR